MAKKVILKDLDNVEILPITRGELIVDSSGKEAFHSNEFLATDSLPGLMSAEDKAKVDNLENISPGANNKVAQVNTTTNEVYRLLFSETADDEDRIEGARKSAKLLFNPSTGVLTASLFDGKLEWSNLNNVPDSFTPAQHTHTTNEIVGLTGYTKAESPENLIITDTLNIALGKLEYKADTVYTWYRSITDEDTDNVINKWQEIVDFVDSVAEGTDITDEFVTRKTALTITGAKIFSNDLTLSAGNEDRYITFDYTGGTGYDWRIGYLGSGSSDANYFVILSDKTDGTYVNALRIGLTTLASVFGGTVTASKFITSGGTSSQFVKGDGSLDSNTYATTTLLGLYLPLTGGTISGTLQIKRNASAIQYLNSDGTVWGWLGFSDKETPTVWMANGSTKYTILHSGNYNYYAPTLTGGGASGTWSINITGNAGSATYIPIVSGINTETAITESGLRAYAGSGSGWTGAVTSMAYAGIITLGTPSRGFQLWARRGAGNTGSLRFRVGNLDANAWETARVLLDNVNWTSYISIPTVTNYYWANVKISSSSNTATTPTFAKTTINGRLVINANVSDASAGTSEVQITNTGTFEGPRLINMFTPNLPVSSSAAQGVHLMFGVSDSTYNSAYMKFWYAGNGSTSNAIRFGFYGSDNLVSILGNGNVGIGTTSPTFNLDVAGKFRALAEIKVQGSTSPLQLPCINWHDENITGFHVSYRHSETTKPLRFYYQTTPSSSTTSTYTLLVDITSTGSVGIGTTAPIHKLQVAGAGVFNNTSSTTYASNGITIGAGDAAARYITCYGKTGASYVNVGYGPGANNSAEFAFNYTSDGSTSNYTIVSMYGAANSMKMYPGYTQFIKNVLAPNYVSSAATGTLPYACTSTTCNTNLNADMLDGYHAGSFGIWRGNIQTDPEADDTTYTTTASFLSQLHSRSSVFNSSFSAFRGSWYYVGNVNYNTGVGTLEMAGTAVLNISGNCNNDVNYKTLLFVDKTGYLYSYVSQESGVATWSRYAKTSEIPNPANYYWANVKVSASSSTSTLPTFNTCYTSNWFRSTGSTGWYNESYAGGWYMTDTTYVRTYNSKAVYVSNTSQHAIYTAGGFASSLTNGHILSTYYNSTWYTSIATHGNGNLSISPPSGSLYLAYTYGNTYFGGSTYYINRSGYFNGTAAAANSVAWANVTGKPTIPTNTWRGVINNLTSTSTTDSLTANMGRVLANGLSDLPVVLLAGTLYRSSAGTTTTWYFTGIRHRSVSSTNPTVSVSGGVACFTFTANTGYTFSIYGVCVNHQASGEATSYTGTEYKTRSSGLYWFGAYASGRNLYIRAISQGDQNNDTAISYAGQWNSYSDGVTRIQIIAVGYAY